MSKSSGNAIELGASEKELREAVMKMYTDPGHLRVSDPGKIQGNVVFSYLRAFDPNEKEVIELEKHYQRGGLGDMVLKRRLAEIMEKELAPIRQARMELDNKTGREFALELLRQGTSMARQQVQEELDKIRKVSGIFRL